MNVAAIERNTVRLLRQEGWEGGMRDGSNVSLQNATLQFPAICRRRQRQNQKRSNSPFARPDNQLARFSKSKSEHCVVLILFKPTAQPEPEAAKSSSKVVHPAADNGQMEGLNNDWLLFSERSYRKRIGCRFACSRIRPSGRRLRRQAKVVGHTGILLIAASCLRIEIRPD